MSWNLFFVFFFFFWVESWTAASRIVWRHPGHNAFLTKLPLPKTMAPSLSACRAVHQRVPPPHPAALISIFNSFCLSVCDCSLRPVIRCCSQVRFCSASASSSWPHSSLSLRKNSATKTGKSNLLFPLVYLFVHHSLLNTAFSAHGKVQKCVNISVVPLLTCRTWKEERYHGLLSGDNQEWIRSVRETVHLLGGWIATQTFFSFPEQRHNHFWSNSPNGSIW